MGSGSAICAAYAVGAWLGRSKQGVIIPGVKEKISPIDGDDLGETEASTYKGVCMRTMFMYKQFLFGHRTPLPKTGETLKKTDWQNTG